MYITGIDLLRVEAEGGLDAGEDLADADDELLERGFELALSFSFSSRLIIRGPAKFFRVLVENIPANNSAQTTLATSGSTAVAVTLSFESPPR